MIKLKKKIEDVIKDNEKAMRFTENKHNIFKCLSKELKNDREIIDNDGVKKLNEEEYDNQLKMVKKLDRNYETDFVFN